MEMSRSCAGKVLDGLAEDLFREAVGVDVGGVEEVDARLHADVDELARLVDVGFAPGLEKLVATAKGSSAEAEFGDFQAGVAELSEIHVLRFSCEIFCLP